MNKANQTLRLAKKICWIINPHDGPEKDLELGLKIACEAQKFLTGFDFERHQQEIEYYKTSAAKAVTVCKKILKKAHPEVTFKVTAEPSAIPCGENKPVVITVITESFADLSQSEKECLLVTLIDTNINKQQKKLIMYYKIRTAEQAAQMKKLNQNITKGVYRNSF